MERIRPYQLSGAVEQRKGDRTILKFSADVGDVSLRWQFVGECLRRSLLLLRLFNKKLSPLFVFWVKPARCLADQRQGCSRFPVPSGSSHLLHISDSSSGE